MKSQSVFKILSSSLIISIFFMLQAFAQDPVQADAQKEVEAQEKEYEYQTFEGDPLNTRLYTLDNGLKVYMTVFRDEPRVQTYIAVRAGSKHDPPETTGLAHYFEHMMFKGTKNYGTTNYEAEAPLIAEVTDLFEVYRNTEDEAERERLYAKIDSISYEASKYGVPNEYDRILSHLGASGTNAYTSLEETVYVNNIPSNQLENFFKVEADRIENVVLRGFHTELETIYEEKNMTLTSDDRKAFTAMLEGLFQKHTYGTQSTIGTTEHIKNPSMKNIYWFHENYYVPNNMAIALSGDFDPDKTIRLIDEQFGHLEAGDVPDFDYTPEASLEEPIIKEVWGPDAERIMMGFRFDGASSKDADLLTMTDMILTNGEAGLFDLNLNQEQRMRNASTSQMVLEDYSTLILTGRPRDGQSLEEVKKLILGELEKIKKGEFDDWLLEAVINDLKNREARRFASNRARANKYVQAFVRGVSWEDELEKINRLEKITKEDIVQFANEKLSDNYVAVYKRTGRDTTIERIYKTRITPIEMNRDKESEYFQMIKEDKPEPIEPEFVNYDEAIDKQQLANGVEILYTPNTINNTFDLYYVFDMGRTYNKMLPIAISYLEYLGTESLSAREFKQEMYKVGASYSINAGADQVYVRLSGLSENIEPAMALFEELLNNAQPDEEALEEMVSDIIRSREDAKKNLQSVFGHLVTYGMYGKDNPATHILSERQLKRLDGEDLTEILHNLKNYKHRVLYYGDQPLEEVVRLVMLKHQMGDDLKEVDAEDFQQQETKRDMVYFVDFDTPQSMILMLSRSVEYDPDLIPVSRLYNAYFGQGMSSLVFQEMRERRSLAYTAMAIFQAPDKKEDYHTNLALIATSHDKIDDAIGGLRDLQNDMPMEEGAFERAQQGLLEEMRTQRTTQSSILFSYLANEKRGLEHDIRRDIYTHVPELTLQDIKDFQNKYISNQPHTIMVVGKDDEVERKMLKEYGRVRNVKLRRIFGY